MSHKALPIFSLIALLTLSAAYLFIQVPLEAARKDAFTFSNTAKWDERLFTLTNAPFSYSDRTFEAILLPDPPRNSSSETGRELAELGRLADNLRTARAVGDMHSEINLDSLYVAGYPLQQWMDERSFPATAALLIDSYRDLTIITMQQKMKFDRVRPSVLDETLDTVIPVPHHPAYPSGHSTQMHFIAHVFNELDPAHRAYYFARAEQIAKNREIAGLHYPSDTEAGKLLAKQFFDILMRNEKFLTLLASAKEEWATHPALVQARASQ
jgi:acid phosphatase (class A)